MLPTNLRKEDLVRWSEYRVPEHISARIVTCAFRNLTVDPDFYSSIPDLFAFSNLEMMTLLWGADGFDFTKAMNPPAEIPLDMDGHIPEDWEDFCAESELYATLRVRLQKMVGRKLDHPTIAKEFLYLINHDRLKICWFDPKSGFRSIFQALQYPWWTERIWRSGEPRVYGMGYPVTEPWQKVAAKINPYLVRAYMYRQKLWYRRFLQKTRVERQSHLRSSGS